VAVLVLKLTLAPGLVGAATLAARRFGEGVGGFVGALPVVAGPILLLYGLQHGTGFAAAAAGATLLGLLSLTAFAWVYAHLAQRTGWFAALIAGWGVFLAGTGLLLLVSAPAVVAAGVALAAFALAVRTMPGGEVAPAMSEPPAWDLPLRLAATAALVLVLTGAAGALGSHASGLLAPFPIITAVLAGFTHGLRGGPAAALLLSGLVSGLASFAAFCLVVALAAEPLGLAGAFGAATAAALVTHAVTFALRRRSPRATAAT
jgi:hypothetical protein